MKWLCRINDFYRLFAWVNKLVCKENALYLGRGLRIQIALEGPLKTQIK